MDVKTISVTYGRKFNLGNYQSAEISMSAWADVEPGENLDTAHRQLWEMCKANVRAQAMPLIKEGSGGEVFLGLPDLTPVLPQVDSETVTVPVTPNLA